MKTIIAGSRTFDNYELLCKVCDEHEITTVISGCAKGADTLAIRYADEKGIKVLQFPALWDIYGRSAGYVRNTVMAENAEALIAFWDVQSKGTKHMIDLAKKKQLKVIVIEENQ